MRPQDTVRASLQRYADRGIFRGFGAAESRGGVLDCRFLWHAPAPHRLRFHSRSRLLVFVDLLPGIPYPSAMDRALRAWLAARSDPARPPHRRLDPTRASTRCRNRAGAVSVEIRSLDGDLEYTTTRAVKLVNEIFLDFLAGPYDELRANLVYGGSLK